MRIAWFTHRYFPSIGGAETYGRAMISRFVESGDQVDVFTSDADDLAYFTDASRRKSHAPRESVVDGARVHRMPVFHFPLQRYVGKALSFLPHWPTQCRADSYLPVIPGLGAIRGDFDAVFGVGFPFTNFSYAALQTARAAGAPLILTPFLHLSTPGDPVHKTYTRPHQIRLLREADLVINPTPRASEVVASWGVPNHRILTLSMAIERMHVVGGDRDAFRYKLGIQPHEKLIGQLGALDPNKGSCDLIRAVERLNTSGRPTRLVLAGNPTREFDQFMQETGAAAHRWLTLTGQLDADVPSFYAALDVFSMPSRTDSFGIVFLEAWANGLPVVAANAGGVPEVITHGETGLLVEFGDVEALASRFADLFENPELAARLGTSGRELVESGYSWQDRFETLRRRTQELVNRRGQSLRGHHLGGLPSQASRTRSL